MSLRNSKKLLLIILLLIATSSMAISVLAQEEPDSQPFPLIFKQSEPTDEDNFLDANMTPQEVIENAWKLAQQSGTYSFRSAIEQTTYPAPTITNAGRDPKQDTLAMEGDIDQPAETLEMTVWPDQSFNPETGIAIRVADNKTFQRTGQGEWEEIDNISDVFAPGGDPLGFLAGMDNIEFGGQETRQFDEGNITLTLTNYTFDLNGPAFADYLRTKMEAQLQATGELPPGIGLSMPDTYRTMTGTGNIWLTDDGLPYRMVMNIDQPGQENGELAEAQITTEFFNFDHAQLESLAVGFFENPQHWSLVRLDLANDAQLWQMVRNASLFLLVLVAITFLTARFWGTREFHIAVTALFILSMVVGPLLQAESVHAFGARQFERQLEHEQQQTQHEAKEAAMAAMNANNWDPHHNPMSESDVNAAASIEETAVATMNNLAAPLLLQSSSVNDATDSDGDGLSDADEAFWFTCDGAPSPNEYCAGVIDSTDTDGDGPE